MKTRLLTILTAAVLMMTLVIGVTPSAHATPTSVEIQWTGIGIYPRSAPSMDASRVGDALPDGAHVSIECEMTGTAVNNGYQTIDIWDRLTDGTFLPNAFLNTGSVTWTPGVPQCGELDRVRATFSGEYDRLGAAENARRFAPTMSLLPADCTYFVSLSLWDGGRLPKSPEWTNDSPDRSLWASKRLAPGLTRAAADASDFVDYMQRSGRATVAAITWSDNTAGGALLGDVIAYEWDSSQPGVDHLAIVTGFTEDGYPLVSQHTPNQVDRYWSWSEASNDWIEFASPGSQAYLVHIIR